METASSPFAPPVRRVLLAFEDEGRAEEVRRRLVRAGMAVETARSGSGMVEIAWRERFDAILVESNDRRWRVDAIEGLAGLPWRPAIHTVFRGTPAEGVLELLAAGRPRVRSDWSGSPRRTAA